MSAHCSHDLVFRQMWSIDHCWRILSAIIADVGDPGPPMSYQHSQLHVEELPSMGQLSSICVRLECYTGNFLCGCRSYCPLGRTSMVRAVG